MKRRTAAKWLAVFFIALLTILTIWVVLISMAGQDLVNFSRYAYNGAYSGGTAIMPRSVWEAHEMEQRGELR